MDYLEANLEHEFLSRLYEPMSKLWSDAPPEKLWRIGELPERSNNRLVVAMVGSRRCSNYGATVAYETAKRLAQLDVIVVSGMAYGIDSYAHRGCIDGGGQTVAVFGTPINKIYPSSNYELARKIVEHGGALLSEYEPGSEVRRQNFIYRNRIVSGLADAVIIVEAAERSGTFSTAKYAADQGRSVFVVPGDINRPGSLGTNRLIQTGASVFTSIEDMLLALHSAWRVKLDKIRRKKPPKDPDGIIGLLEKGSETMDSLAEKLKMNISELAAKLTMLEIDSYIKCDSVGNWSLV